MKAFMENKGVTDIHDCDMQELKNLLLYHIISGRYSSYGELDVEPRILIVRFILQWMILKTGY